ncbi:MAG: peptidylprolyl isomerase, partial [Bacteroidia bacterium]
LGKCITKSKVDKLLEIKNTNQAGYGECIYRAMLKRADHIELKDNMVKLLNEDNIDNKFYAAWYLSRTIYPINSENFKEILKLNTYPEPWSMPMPLMVALGKATLNKRDSLIVRDNLISNIFVDKDQKFKDGGLKTVVSFRTFILKKFNFDSTDNWLELNANGITYPPIQLAYSEFISKNCKVFKKYSNLTYGPAIVNILKNPECKNFSLKLPVTNTIYDKIWNLQLLETSYQNYPIINNILMQTESPAVKSAATESLIKCRNNKGFPESLVADFNKTIEILIKDGDEGALSIIANAILDKQLGLDSNYRQLFIEAQSNLNLPQEMEAYIDIAKVLAIIHKTDYKKPEPEWNHAIDWNFVSKIKTDQKIKVTTTQGEFIIQMNVNEAPGSVASILKLVDEGFYNGKFFHRMVPNFVIQGGCPRGDGFGSQEYTIRSEFSSLKYSTGAVGLASAGPDTESCQWFATHCPTPHLDGRYTIIGYVISGMDTVHKLGVGDVILKVIRVTP